MNWQYTEPALAARAHHVEDLTKEAADYRRTRALMSTRRRERLSSAKAWTIRCLLLATGQAGRRRRATTGLSEGGLGLEVGRIR